MTIQNKFNNSLWFQFILPLFFLWWGLNTIYSYGCWEFDPDEGINLMKAFMLNDGYQLYQEIWNDQPPILTHLLASIFSVFEPKVELARSFILIFSTIILWQTWLVLYLFGGILHACIGILFLLISPNYLKLSISVMVGLPCIALGMGAILSIIWWHSTHKTIWLIISALLLSLSILTKLFTFFLAPIIVIGIALDRAENIKKISWQQKLRSLALWIIILFSFSLLILLSLVGIDNIHLLLENHTSARNIDAFQDMTLRHSLRNDYRLFLGGFTIWGILIAYQRQQWQIFYFAAWSITAYLLLIDHKPIWYHQVLLLHIPAIIMVGYAMGEIISRALPRGLYLRPNRRIISLFLGVAIIISSILLVGEQTKTTWRAIKSWQKNCSHQTISVSLEAEFLAEIVQFKSQTNWMVTDSPIFAFRAGIPVPPSTAVLSMKQVETGNMSDRQLIDIINQYKPEQVFLKRFSWTEVTDFIKQNYQLQKQEADFRLYIRIK